MIRTESTLGEESTKNRAQARWSDMADTGVSLRTPIPLADPKLFRTAALQPDSGPPAWRRPGGMHPLAAGPRNQTQAHTRGFRLGCGEGPGASHASVTKKRNDWRKSKVGME